jgi:acetylornithine deacetylase/succinyl-diaminopimelate desuccinylase-like protein
VGERRREDRPPGPDRAAVQEWLDERASEMADLVARLVAIPTENPPGRELGRCAAALRDAARAVALDAAVVDLPPERDLEQPALVEARTGEGGRAVYFHGHFDVVPAQDAAQLEARREGGRVVGRGSADMKGGLVSMIYAAAAVQALGLVDGGRLLLRFVPDEETGSSCGSAYLAANGLIDPAAVAMLTAEPTGGVVWNASRGAITLLVRVGGRTAHVGQAHLGDNAFERLLDVAEPLRRLAADLRDTRTSYRLDGDEARGSMLVVGGEAGSGASFNAVPGSAWFSVDRRFNPEEDLDEELDRLLRTIDRAADAAAANVNVEVVQQAPAAATPEDHPAARLLADCVAAVEQAEPPFELCPGVLETRWYARRGIPSFAYGPGRLDVSHGPDEFVDEQALVSCAAVYALFAARALARGSPA